MTWYPSGIILGGFILFRNFVIKGVDVSLFCSVKRTDLKSE